jgi:hypothetical protein
MNSRAVLIAVVLCAAAVVCAAATEHHSDVRKAVKTHSSVRGGHHGRVRHHTNNWIVQMHDKFNHVEMTNFIASLNNQLTVGTIKLHRLIHTHAATTVVLSADKDVSPDELTTVLMSEQRRAETTKHGVEWFHRDVVAQRHRR